MKTRTIITAAQASEFARFLTGLALPFTVTWSEDGKRTLSQNALMWRWNTEIAQHFGDRTADDVHRENKYLIGCSILVRDDPDFAAFVSNLRGLTYDEKVQAMDYVSVTSIMTKPQAREYMDRVHAKFAGQGVVLTDPEMMKMEAFNDG